MTKVAILWIEMDSEHPYGHLKGKISDYGHISKRKKKREERNATMKKIYMSFNYLNPWN